MVKGGVRGGNAIAIILHNSSSPKSINTSDIKERVAAVGQGHQGHGEIWDRVEMKKSFKRRVREEGSPKEES